MSDFEDVFVYGSLRDSRVQKAVIGRKITGENDFIDGHRVENAKISIFCFPMIIPDDSCSVEGLVLKLTGEELSKVDDFENDHYIRKRLKLRSGREAWVYEGNLK